MATPAADVRWEHHPSHFWLILAAELTSAALAFQTGGIALRRADARMFRVSPAFLSAAGFLALHVRGPALPAHGGAIRLRDPAHGASACLLLAEAMVAVAVVRNWQLT